MCETREHTNQFWQSKKNMKILRLPRNRAEMSAVRKKNLQCTNFPTIIGIGIHLLSKGYIVNFTSSWWSFLLPKLVLISKVIRMKIQIS